MLSGTAQVCPVDCLACTIENRTDRELKKNFILKFDSGYIFPPEVSHQECGEDGSVLMSGSGGPEHCAPRPQVPAGIQCAGRSGKCMQPLALPSTYTNSTCPSILLPLPTSSLGEKQPWFEAKCD